MSNGDDSEDNVMTGCGTPQQRNNHVRSSSVSSFHWCCVNCEIVSEKVGWILLFLEFSLWIN